MPGPLKKVLPFRRRGGRQLPGQTTDDELGLGLTIRYVERPSHTVINRELVRIGNVDLGRFVEIDHDGLKLYANALIHTEIQSDGDMFIGEDVSDPGKSVLSIFANNQTYNSESVTAGDVLFGDNSASKANMYWDKSEGQLKFRGGTTTQLYIDTDGSLTAGAGEVTLNSDGLQLKQGSSGPNKIEVLDGAAIVGELYAWTDPGVSSQLILIGRGKGDVGTDTPEGLVQITAITHDGTVHGGSASVGIALTTSNDRATISAGETRIIGDLEVTGAAVFNELSQNEDFRIESNNQTHLFFIDADSDNIGISTNNPHDSCVMDFENSLLAIRLPRLSTAERNNLSAVTGMIIYNKSTGYFQGYAAAGGDGWKDLH